MKSISSCLLALSLLVTLNAAGQKRRRIKMENGDKLKLTVDDAPENIRKQTASVTIFQRFQDADVYDLFELPLSFDLEYQKYNQDLSRVMQVNAVMPFIDMFKENSEGFVLPISADAQMKWSLFRKTRSAPAITYLFNASKTKGIKVDMPLTKVTGLYGRTGLNYFQGTFSYIIPENQNTKSVVRGSHSLSVFGGLTLMVIRNTNLSNEEYVAQIKSVTHEFYADLLMAPVVNAVGVSGIPTETYNYGDKNQVLDKDTYGIKTNNIGWRLGWASRKMKSDSFGTGVKAEIAMMPFVEGSSFYAQIGYRLYLGFGHQKKVTSSNTKRRGGGLNEF